MTLEETLVDQRLAGEAATATGGQLSEQRMSSAMPSVSSQWGRPAPNRALDPLNRNFQLPGTSTSKPATNGTSSQFFEHISAESNF